MQLRDAIERYCNTCKSEVEVRGAIRDANARFNGEDVRCTSER